MSVRVGRCLAIGLLPLLLLAGACSNETPRSRLDEIRECGRLTVVTRNNAHCYHIYRGESMGFEYDLARAFADYLGVGLKVRTSRWQDMLTDVNEGKGDVVAASLTMTPSREELADFSRAYMVVRQHLIVHKDDYRINDLEALNGTVIHVRKGTSYEDTLGKLRNRGLEIDIRTYEDLPTEELIRKVAEGHIEITVADSNVAMLNRRYFPEVKIGIPIEEPQALGWAVKKGEKALLGHINTFFETIRADGTFSKIYRAYYGNVEVFDRFDLQKFHERIGTRLPRYEVTIKRAARQHGFDWRLIAAVIYQESHFDPEAVSHRGVRGLMQLTLQTASEMGVEDRLNPVQSIAGGVRYLRQLYEKSDGSDESDRLKIALASYNVGPQHVADAQTIARRQGLDPRKWSSLEKTLPLLCREEYIRQSRHGYCRGIEPVRFVERVFSYYDILKRKAFDLAESASQVHTP